MGRALVEPEQKLPGPGRYDRHFIVRASEAAYRLKRIEPHQCHELDLLVTPTLSSSIP
jgi:hypothetical protein